MSDHSDKYRCTYCNKIYASTSSLWNHNNNFHSIKQEKVRNYGPKKSEFGPKKSEKNYLCRCCGKIYYNKNSRWSHEQKCKNSELVILEKENNEAKKQIINNNNITNNKQINNGTINNTNNNTNNNTQNIVINQIGKESVDSLPIKDILKILGDGNNMPITCIKKVNFNKNLPENHSFCTTTLEGKHFTRINHKTQKSEKINKVDFINEVLNSSLRFIQNISLMVEFDESFRETIPLEYQNKLKEIINNQQKFHDPKNKKAFFNCINDMSYNFKDIILKTWKLIQQNDTKENILSDEELLIDENFNYMDFSDEEK
jgi:hypothetical protein